MLVLAPDSDSSQDSRKVSQGIFQPQTHDEVIEGDIFALWVVTTIAHKNL